MPCAPSTRRRGIAAGTTLGLVLLAGSAAAQSTPIDFNRDIRPILSDRCFACHGFDGQARKAGLRLDTREGQTTAIDGRTPVVPHDAENSELLHRIESDDVEFRMPPADSGLSLSGEERALLRRWIETGAEYAPHWAFLAPPEVAAPKDPFAAARNEIDHFIGRRLAVAGLEPSAEADRATLIRRVSLDLIGLPPTLEELDAFAADEQPGAFERVVDRMLASPRFGERMALVWLDAARYADTNGFHHDNLRTGWPYRDWVIRAFNDNLPYDRFVTEQVAGDMLEGATEQQQIASGFCRMHNINDEGGALDPEYRVEAICDRIETIATTFMGLTLACCRCHDHKYDPLTQEDYYGVYAFFNSVDERGVYAHNLEQARAYPARLMYRTGDLSERTEATRQKLASAREELTAAAPKFDAERRAWRDALVGERGFAWVDAKVTATAKSGLPLEPQDDGSFLTKGNAGSDRHTFELETDATDLRVVMFEALPDPSLPDGRLSLAAHGNVVVSKFEATVISLRDPERRRELEWRWAWADHEQPNGDFDIFNALDDSADGWALDAHRARGSHLALLLADQPFGYEGGSKVVVTVCYESQYELHIAGRPRVSLARATKDLTLDFPTVASDWWLAGPFRTKPASYDAAYDTAFGPESVARIQRGHEFDDGEKWRHMPKFRDGTVEQLSGGNAAFYVARSLTTPIPRKLALSLGSDDGIRVFLNGSEVFANNVQRGAAADQEQLQLDLPAGENLLVLKIVNGGGPAGFYYRADAPSATPTRLLPAAFVDPTRRDPALESEYTAEWSSNRSPTFAALTARIADLERDLAELDAQAVPVLVMQELPEPRPTFVLHRGAYDGADESRPVERRTPSALGAGLPDGAPRNRLGFAQWLVRPDHPLTARVHVNRLWQMLFGRGLVATSENFGMQSDWPSHPELLDWLARFFVDGGWDQKRLIREIVTSRTYRQASRIHAAAITCDPDNALLAYFPRRRLSGELLRDSALFVAGLLEDEIGGPSVKPYQPPGLWREVSIGGNSNTQLFRRDDGAALYRRSLYTFWKRTSPSPQMAMFDAPTREFCVVRRGTTNTPLQALVLWNDEQFVEASRALAERVLVEVVEDDDVARLSRAFRLCTGREPESLEVSILLRALDGFRARYAESLDDAKALLAVGEKMAPTDIEPRELAAWTMVANALLSLDETIVKG